MHAEALWELLFEKKERPEILVIAAHPDDETIGCGATLKKASDRVRVLHITDGAPRDMVDAEASGFSTREAYARTRRLEAHAALKLAGLGPERCRQLGIVDKEAALNMREITLMLRDIILETSPGMILTHPYEGGHPDHDAASFCALSAVELLRRGPARAHFELPVVCEMSSYHARENAEGRTRMAFYEFLPCYGREVVTVKLTRPERELKAAMMDCFTTQKKILQAIPLDIEIFRAAPSYDFTRPPHPGQPLYESYNWGMTSNKWLKLTQKAMRDLQI
jgi:LmbE family N-acetylglucosaminyl deacetylase